MSIDLTKLPLAPDDALISGRTWNRLRRADLSAAPGIGTFEQPEPPRGIEMLMIVVNAGPNGEADPANNTYWLKNVNVEAANDETTQLKVTARDDEDESQIWILATNLSEAIDETHSVPVDTPVLAKMIRDSNGQRRWEFSFSPPGGLTVKDCADSGAVVSNLRFKGGFSVTDPGGSQRDVALAIEADPAHPGIIITYDENSCTPMRIGLLCTATLTAVTNVRYDAGTKTEYQAKTTFNLCTGAIVSGPTETVVFTATSCPTSTGLSLAELAAT